MWRRAASPQAVSVRLSAFSFCMSMHQLERTARESDMRKIVAARKDSHI
jgi:hypothetical protein